MTAAVLAFGLLGVLFWLAPDLGKSAWCVVRWLFWVTVFLLLCHVGGYGIVHDATFWEAWTTLGPA